MDQLLTEPLLVHEGSWTLADDEFLKSLEWGRGGSVAPLRKVAKKGDTKEFAKLLERELRRRFPAAKFDRKKAAAVVPNRLLWSRPAFDESLRSIALVEILASLDADNFQKPDRARKAPGGKKTATKRSSNAGAATTGVEPAINHWLDSFDGAEPVSTFEQLLLVDLLRRSTGRLARGTQFRVWRLLLSATLESQPAAPSEEDAEPQLLTDQDLVAQGELPWTLGVFFSGLAVADDLRAQGRRQLQGSLLAGADEIGMPRADLLERLSFWMAPFVRAREFAAQTGLKLWDAKCEKRFRLLAHSASMMCRADGRLPMSNGFLSTSIDLLNSASKLAGLNEQSAPRVYLQELSNARLFPSKGSKRKRGGLRSRRKSRKAASSSAKSAVKYPAAQSDSARLACLRSNWSAEADTLVVAHDDAMPRIELSALGKPLFSGRWDIALTVDGTPLEFTSEWSCVCWFSDEDADYIELRTDHPAGVRIERQILLSREEHFALFAEIVSGPAGAKIECESRLLPVAGASLIPDRPTRECRLKVPGCTARVFPMMLPAERVVGAAGSLGLVDDALQFRQTGIGGMYAPIVIGWHPARARAYAEWRKLTVSEQGKAVPGDWAGGCRLRVGSDQWLFYHGMRKSQGGRAVLGQHTFNETLIGTFSKDGTVEPIILVEQQEV